MITIRLAAQFEKLNPINPFAEQMPMLLYHQYRTYRALQTHDLVMNAYNTGTGKTKAALLHLRDAPSSNVLFIAPTNELIRQHVNDINKFVSDHKLQFHVLEVNAAVLRNLGMDKLTVGNGERLYRLINNPLEFAEQLRLDVSNEAKPVILVTNPDIFYYALYFSYASKDRRNMFETILKRFDYVVIDEFHYYNIKQLANFLFFFILCDEFGYLDGTRKICLLSATPNAIVIEFLRQMKIRHALIIPDNEPDESVDYPKIPSLADVELQLSDAQSLQELVEQQRDQIRRYLLEEHLDGAIISSALWKINQINQRLDDLPQGSKGRITGAETSESRRHAQYCPLILATPTVDIGYNFEKHQKDRQNIDFLFFDATFRDDFLQRLGRVGRTLGKRETDCLSYAYAVSDPAVLEAIKQSGQTHFDRKEFAALINTSLPPKHDVQKYIRFHALTEVFYPIYEIEKMMPKELEERLHRLFDTIKSVFAPNSRRTFGDLRTLFWEYDEQKRILIEKDETSLQKMLPLFVRERTGDTPSDAHLEQLTAMISTSRDLKTNVLEFVQERYAITNALFHFRDAFQGPTAIVFDPRHLLSEQDVNEYDLFHLLANFKVIAHSQKRFEELTEQHIRTDALYFEINGFQEPRLLVGFRYETDLPCEQFEQTYCNQIKALTHLQITLALPNNIPVPIAPEAASALQTICVPCLIVHPSDRGKLFTTLNKKGIYKRSLMVQVADSGAEIEYPVLLGTSALLVHAEMYGYFYMKRKKQPEYWCI